MTRPAFHAVTHRLKDFGGTDSLIPSLPTFRGINIGAGNQSVTTDDQLILEDSEVYTNCRDIFRFDSTDPKGVLIYRGGIYMFGAKVAYTSGSIAVSRSMYQACQPVGSGPSAAFGNELLENGFVMGTGQGASGFTEAPGPGGTGKAVLYHYAVGRLTEPDESNPWRYCVVLIHNGVNYDVGNLGSGVMIVRLSDDFVLTANLGTIEDDDPGA